MLVILLFTLVASAVVSSAHANQGVIDDDFPQISYVLFESSNITSALPTPLPPTFENKLNISGELRVPVRGDPGDKVPAVVILHGSAGIDTRGKLYKEALNAVGIATLEVDMFGPRGLGVGERPFLPTENVPDAFGALAYLKTDNRIDPDRIGLLGFSWGGVVTMLAASEYYYTNSVFNPGMGNFTSFVAHYPICWSYLAFPQLEFGNLTGPLLIQIGDLDDYDNGSEPCEALIASRPDEDRLLLSLNVYNNAYHGWDRLQPELFFFDPFANQGGMGAGGNVTIAPSPGKAFQSRRNVTWFFQQNL